MMQQRNQGVCPRLTQVQLLQKIREADFAADEAILFLDTHPRCSGALKYLDAARKKSRELTLEYESRFGPITAEGRDSSEDGEWKWVMSPWPWQNELSAKRQCNGRGNY